MSDPEHTGRSDRKPMERARDGAEALREEASAAFEEVKAQGASVVESAQARLGEIADERKDAGVRQAQGLARAIHRAADEIEGSAPWMARYVHEAADSVDGLARSLRDRRPRELVGSLEDLARRQPMAFFGAAALAGFAVARFARSSPAPGRGVRRHLGGSMGHAMGEATNREGSIASGSPGWQAHESGARPQGGMTGTSFGSTG